ncbi:chemotaxis response regulator protein-glutamate methylesterase CheB [Bacillus sp. TS-2]|nr:chemotaxis response regulator protein-glutamate methylesterase CheB [Bacillus sp. TS-2]
MKKYRVLVVDDSAFMRKMISDMLNRDPMIEVIGTARNGQEAISKRRQLNPDVMTLDVEMPVLDGLQTLKMIMEENPCPIIMLSSTTKEGATNTMIAMEYGAVDFIAKTSGAISLDINKIAEIIVYKVKCAAKVKNLKSTIVSLPTVRKKRPILPIKRSYSQKKKIFLIGTSTGGPKALKEVLTQLPAHFPWPIVIVQHMPAGFTNSLAERLNSLSEITVKEAEKGEVLQNGTAYIAPGGYHIGLLQTEQNLMIDYLDEEPIKGLKPAVDLLFRSASSLLTVEKVAIIMTGMGADGTEGLLSLKSAGGCYAIAQSEESSIVFGMPKVAIKSKVIDEIVHLEEIAETMLKHI